MSRSFNSPSQVSELLSEPQSGALGGLLRRARALLQLERLIKGAVDPSLADHFKVANVRDQKLVLLTPGAAWATRLRMQAPQILELLRVAGVSDVQDIEIRVAPLPTEPVDQRRSRPLTPAASQALGSMARLAAEADQAETEDED